MSNTNTSCPRVDIGGQAVMEGVMMKAPDAIAISVRRPNGKIVVKRTGYTPASKKHAWMGWPFIRGIINMGSMLAMGMRTLQDSTDMLGVMDEEPTKFEKWLSQKLGKGIDKIVMAVAVVLAVVLAMGLFVLVPSLFGQLFRSFISSTVVVNLLEGVIRIAILIGYMIFCGKVPDVRRTFQYHGAEHKTVYCHEHDLPLTPENARPFTTLHPRCGTSFLFIVFFLSMLAHVVVAYNGPLFIWRFLSRLALLPIMAGVSYEVLKGLAHADGKLVHALRWPGMQLQRLTTKEPDDSMLEIAICSMNVALHGIPKHVTPDKNGWFYIDSYKETEPGYVPPVQEENEAETDAEIEA
ncbi:MAG: DUF1385 domain-containing protein [Clostridia bacterium]|nr:DUF1385 domain-containing protein [Clostridia bacterium]